MYSRAAGVEGRYLRDAPGTDPANNGVSGPLPPNGQTLRLAERWFVRQGIPHFIEDYQSRTHVLPRMLPVMLFLLAAAVDPVGNLLSGAALGIWFAVEFLLVYGIWGWAYALAPSPWRILPSRVGWSWPLAAFLCLPVATAFVHLSGLTPQQSLSGYPIVDLALFALASLIVMPVVLGLGYFVTSYGLVPLSRRILSQVLGDLARSLPLQARTMPVLLIANVFLFFTGELWQVASRLTGWRVGVLVGLFALLSVLVIATGVREEMARIQRTLSADRVTAECAGTPLERLAPRLAPYATPTPLRRQQELNMLMVFGARQLIQAAVVALGVFLFFTVLGFIVLDAAVTASWIGNTPAGPVPASPLWTISVGPVDWTLTVGGWVVTMAKLATTLSAFSAFSFVVTTVNDTHYRERFFAPAVRELERWLAVRAAYQVLYRHWWAPTPPVAPAAAPPATPPAASSAAPHGRARDLHRMRHACLPTSRTPQASSR